LPAGDKNFGEHNFLALADQNPQTKTTNRYFQIGVEP